MTTTTTTDCPKCNARGTIAGRNASGAAGSFSCDLCRGTGAFGQGDLDVIIRYGKGLRADLDRMIEDASFESPEMAAQTLRCAASTRRELEAARRAYRALAA